MVKESSLATTDPTKRYREVQVKTSAQDDLLMLLLDGGVRFTEGALLEIQKGSDEDRARRNDLSIRAQKIVLELMGALSPAIGLELYNSLQDLYRFTFLRIFEGNARSEEALIAEGVVLFKRLREMWSEAIEKARSEKEVAPAKPTPNSSLSVQG